MFIKTEKNKTRKKGGSVIASGGFGCLFKPQLNCESTAKSLKNKGVTKLMLTKYAHQEYTEIVKYKPLLEKINNYKNFFLIDGFSLCKPSPLSEEDLKNFDKKCSALKKKEITKDNLNHSLNKLMALNMPYGGVDLGDFIEKNDSFTKELIIVNEKLIELLEKGIIPMNQAGVFHCDLKSSNILVNKENDEYFTRIIDWGLSTTFFHGEKIPKILTNRPFQYNVPFSNILFTSLFTKLYNEFCEKDSDHSYHSVRTFIINYVLLWVEKRGPGHLKTINSIFKYLFENDLTNVDETFKDDLIEYDFTFYFIFEYLTQIILKYTKNNRFDSLLYFEEVFIKNIDIWGFVMSYIPLLEYLHNNFKKITTKQKEVIQIIKKMIIILLENSDTPIPVYDITNELHILNNLLPHLLPQLNKKTEISIGSTTLLSPNKKEKQKKQHIIMVNTLKHIKHRHENNLWM